MSNQFSSSGTVMIVDDDPSIRQYLSRVCNRLGYESILAANPTEAVARLSCQNLLVIFTDLQMPERDGVEFLRLLAEIRTDVPVVILSGFDPRVLHAAQKFGASVGLSIVDALKKPVTMSTLEAVLAKVSGQTSLPLECELVASIERGEFILYFQPKICVQPPEFGHVMGFEGLARWQHHRKGLIMPNEFIPAAESTGHISSLTDALIDYGLTELQRWNTSGHRFSLALNISPAMLHERGLADRIHGKSKTLGIEPHQLMLEITESGAMADVPASMEILTRLRLKGFELSIDDFGTGYSSLVQLYDLPFSELKIDRSFVRDIEHREDAKVIVRTLSDLAHNLSLKACAEGVETEAELELLVESGCDRVQGFFIGEPMPAAVIPAWLAEWSTRCTKLAGNRQEQHALELISK